MSESQSESDAISRAREYLDEWEVSYGMGAPLPEHWGIAQRISELRALLDPDAIREHMARAWYEAMETVATHHGSFGLPVHCPYRKETGQ